MRKSSIGLIAVAGLALGGCGYNGIGLGVGYGSPYGYGGYGGYGGYYDPYRDPYFGYGSRYSYGYSPYGYGMYGSPYGGGWHNGYYYPGSGYYIYDRDRNKREMTDAEKAFWRQRVASTLANRIRENRGDTVTTNQIRRAQSVRTQSVRTRDVTTRNSDRRERVSRSLSERIQARRAERAAQRKNDDD